MARRRNPERRLAKWLGRLDVLAFLVVILAAMAGVVLLVRFG